MIIVRASVALDGSELAHDNVLVEMMKFHESLVKAGVVRWVEALDPSSRGLMVQFIAGKQTVLHGRVPTPQEFAGFWIIEVPSKEQAVEWTCQVPLVDGLVELREALFQILPVDYDDRSKGPGGFSSRMGAKLYR